MTWGVPDRLRSGPVRAMVQIAMVLALVVIAWQVGGLRDEADQNEQTATAVNAILARSCGVASFEELRKQGLVEECRLAQDGGLVDAIPEDELPEPGADPTDVNPDLVEDDETSTPADVDPVPLPEGPSNDQVQAAVDDYFAANPLSTQPGYERAIQRTVAFYLTENPPEPGRAPTKAEIREAVSIALEANPPEDGVDGVDGETGPPGPAPTQEQIAAAVAAYCQANGECRGPAGADGQQGPPGPPGVVEVSDQCQPADDEYVTDVNISDPVDGVITLTCTAERIIPGLGN